MLKLLQINLIPTAVISFVVALSAVLLLAAAPVRAVTNTELNVRCGTNISLDGGPCSVAGGTSTVQDTIRNAINVISVIVGVVAVIMLIFGGFRYVTSGGDASATKSARDTILYALVGLVIVAIAQAIVQFVLQSTVSTS